MYVTPLIVNISPNYHQALISEKTGIGREFFHLRGILYCLLPHKKMPVMKTGASRIA
jgi:hypothetical protein